jgi:uncharacterized protein (DUF305 family)
MGHRHASVARNWLVRSTSERSGEFNVHKRLVNRLALIGASTLLGASAMTAGAQQQAASMPGMDMSHAAGNTPSGSSGASSQAFKDADQKMMQNMNSPSYTGDADKDFVSHMIPHHQGAIDMAQVELKYGKDPILRRLAHQIIKAQQDEIKLMQRWQEKRAQ